MKSIPLSVLDKSPVHGGGTAADTTITETLELVLRCQQWRYQRYRPAEVRAA